MSVNLIRTNSPRLALISLVDRTHKLTCDHTPMRTIKTLRALLPSLAVPETQIQLNILYIVGFDLLSITQ